TRVGPGRVDGARECRRNGGARSVEVAHERRNGVPDALQRSHAGEKTENRGRHTRREGEPLPLMEPLAARELVADRKRSRGGRVHARQLPLELPGSGAEPRTL